MADQQGYTLRRFPYPYKAMLAICSDLDETPDGDAYWEIARYLNTTQTTAMGQGAGLEVGNTIYFDMPAEQFSYWNTNDAGRAMVRALIQSGHVDCLHSYGDLATTREHAGRALDELEKHDCTLKVWIDHATAPTNFGADIMQGAGDVPGSPVYHADLTCGFGVEYVWRGRVTSVIGQDRPRSLVGVGNLRHPIASMRTLGKEWMKGRLAARGNDKYAMHASNDLVERAALRDGRPTREFMRCNPHWGGVSCGDTADGLGDVLTDRFLTRLVHREGSCVLYTHLGKVRGIERPFPPKTCDALHRLSCYESTGSVLVTTTSRLLQYRDVQRNVRCDGNSHTLTISLAGERSTSIDDLQGITVYCDNPERVAMSVNGTPVESLQINPPDETGRRSVSIPWRQLEFPQR